MDQNKQEQQHSDAVICFYWLSDPEEEEETFYKLLEWTSHSQIPVIIDWEEINTSLCVWTAPDCLENSLKEKGLLPWWAASWLWAVCLAEKMTHSILSCIRESFASKLKEVILPLRPSENYPECRVQFLSPQNKRQRDTQKYWSKSHKMGHKDQDLGASVIWESEKSRTVHRRQEEAQENLTNIFI